MQELSKKDLAKAEAGGFPIVALILLVVFGSLAAAALPLALGFVSVIVTGALIYFISLQMETSVFVTNMASMIGIGVAIDYSLFILARYREERRAGREPDEARAQALATSGLAVTFSGLAVIVSLAGLWMVDNQALRSMALGAMTVVAVSILTATTLLPVADRDARRPRHARRHRRQGHSLLQAPGSFRRRGAASRPRERRTAFWERWTHAVMARPWTAVIGVSAVLLTLAIPLLSIETGTEALNQFPKGSDVRVGNELAQKQLGGGTDPVQIVAPSSGARRTAPRSPPSSASWPATAGRRLGRAARLRRRERPLPGDAERAAASPTRPSPWSSACATRSCPPPRSAGSRPSTSAAKPPAAEDARAQISGSMWKIVLFVLALSFLVLMVMLRSLLLPLKAVLMNLLSIGAAFGVLVAIFQWGWFDSLLGFESQGALDTINVPLIFAIVFGLSMDYEVFLMSRIRERYMAHGDNERAVAEGLSSSARTISSAALIMTCVFAVFVLTGVPSIKELGLGCAVAIALDATLVRLILVPAAMKLLGDWNWWMPSWLDRALPNLSFEDGASRARARRG